MIPLVLFDIAGHDNSTLIQYRELRNALLTSALVHDFFKLNFGDFEKRERRQIAVVESALLKHFKRLLLQARREKTRSLSSRRIKRKVICQRGATEWMKVAGVDRCFSP